MSHARLLIVPLLAGSLLATGGCSVNPATGRQELVLMSPAEELSIGKQEHPKVLAEYGGAYEDAKLRAYVDRIGKRLAAQSELPDLDFTFTLLDSDVVNAFALPGGYVYVTRGLLALADNEAELAGVLGHEIGHVTARHTAQRQTQATYGGLGTLGATVLGAVLLGDAGAQLGQQVGSYGTAAWVQGYSRDQELEADQLGIRYLSRAGYDPRAMATFLDALRENDGLQRRLAGRGEEQAEEPSWLASHPRTEDRIVQAADAAADATDGGELDRDRFLAAIDGMVYGESPEQGFVRGRRFVHPGMKIAFEAPPGFRLTNTPAAVLGQDGKGRAMVFDGAASDTSDMLAYLTRDWTGGKRVQDAQRLTVGGEPAAVAFAGVTLSGQPATAMLAAVAGSGKQVYRFVFARRGGELSAADVAAFEQSLRSFGHPSAAETAALKPRAIKIATVSPGDTVATLARQMQVEQLPEETFRVLNDLERNEPKPGQKVKLVEIR